MKAIRVHQYGPPEVLTVDEMPDPSPGPGEVVIDVVAIGTVFSETQVRAGQLARFGLRGPDMPYVIGRDVAGTVAELGDGVDPSLLGARVAASTTGSGGYAERVAVSVGGPTGRGAVFSCFNVIPEGLGFEDAVALMGQGRTALALARVGNVGPDDSVLITAAAGGVGTLLVQLARAAGARLVIGASRGDHKLAALKELGCDLVVDYSAADWGDRVRAAVGPDGVDLVYDGVGGEIARTAYTLAGDGIGRVVIFGLASGELAELSAGELLGRGLTVTGFAGARFARRPEWVLELQTEILELAARGVVRPLIGQRFPLEQAADAHRAMEARDTLGKTLLIPQSRAGAATGGSAS